MSTKQPPQAKDDDEPAGRLEQDEPGSNDVEHEPDPRAKPIPDGHHKYTPRSPYTTGND
jgi:hypothetical protein